MGIGRRIKERREYLGITRQELADRIGVTVSAISNYENEISSPKEPIMFKLFKTLQCDANYLYQDEMIDGQIKKDPVFTGPLDAMQRAAFKLFQELSPDNQNHAKEYLHFLLERQSKAENK